MEFQILKNGRPYSELQVFCMSEPVDGIVASPTRVVLHDLNDLASLFDNYGKAMTNSANPDYVILSREAGKLETDPLAAAEAYLSSEGIMYNDDEKLVRYRRSKEEDREAVSYATQVFENKAYPDQIPAIWMRRPGVVMPMGQDIRPFPLPTLPQYIPNLVEAVLENIL